jgi:SAM-dependent methyltransferase
MLGAKVVACEEVRKYSKVTDFLINAYGMKNIITAPYSLYDLPADFNNKFDVVHYSGVLYHVSDPLLSLRLLYNVLKPGGIILIETNACCLNLCKFFFFKSLNLIFLIVNSLEPGRLAPYITYEGSTYRRGNNWFNPSPLALRNMMLDMGFENVQVTLSNVALVRMYAVGQKVKYKDFLRAGFARTDIC